MGNIHPRFLSWVIGNGTGGALLSDLMASAANPNCGGGNHAAPHVELQVLRWLRELLDLPPAFSGVLTSGASIANLVCLQVARQHALGDVRKEGLFGRKPLTFYASTETHSSITRAIETLGIGNKHLRKVPVDSAFRIDVLSLRKMIDDDKEAGLQPACVIAHAGTVNSGAVDNIRDLATLCRELQLWLHVDGAFGALAYLSNDEEHRELLAGLQSANSIVFDAHKWLNVTYDAGVAFVRNTGGIHRATFELVPEYLERQPGLAGGDFWPSQYGLQLSSGFRSLKIWSMLRENGAARVRAVITKCLNMARYVEHLCRKSEHIQVLQQVQLNIAVFRFVHPALTASELDQLNRTLLLDLHNSGRIAPSYTTMLGRYWLRACFVGHRVQKSDAEALVELVLAFGTRLANEALQKK